MCNFVPGEVVAFGPTYDLQNLGGDLPGSLADIRPLVSHVGEFPAGSELTKFGTVTLKTDPGLELYAVSRMSARLAGAIERREAIVDLNHILPLSAPDPITGAIPRLSPHAQREAGAIRRMLRTTMLAGNGPIRVAVLDSGLAGDFVANRTLRYFDYAANGRLTLDAERVDPLGHGTRVATILDQILPSEVELCVGRLPAEAGALTALTVAHALGDIIARQDPEVVNLSIAPRNDWFLCPHCRKRVPAPTFLSTFLPLVVRLGGRNATRTITVMAAGNTGQIPNSRWLSADTETLLFAVAENRNGDRTRYSGAPEGPDADLHSAGAFGGDDPEDPGAQGVFVDGTHGTSFAAPFVSAAVLLSKRFHEPGGPMTPNRIGEITRDIIEAARNGRSLR